MATMNISVPGPMRDWVKTQIDGGKYASSSDYVRDLIRKDQGQQDKLLASKIDPATARWLAMHSTGSSMLLFQQ